MDHSGGDVSDRYSYFLSLTLTPYGAHASDSPPENFKTHEPEPFPGPPEPPRRGSCIGEYLGSHPSAKALESSSHWIAGAQELSPAGTNMWFEEQQSFSVQKFSFL